MNHKKTIHPPIQDIYKQAKPNIVGLLLLLTYILLAPLAVYDLFLEFTWDKIFLVISLYIIFNGFFQQAIYHRYVAHNQYQVSNWVHKFFLIIGCFASIGTAHTWKRGHMVHHAYADTKNDVHSPGGNFFFMHKLLLYGPIEQIKTSDSVYNLAHKYYYHILVPFIIIIGMIDIYWLAYYSLQILVGNFLFSDLFNRYAHLKIWSSYRNFDTIDTSYNHLLFGLTGGEYHNNHHRFPQNANQGINWWEFDYVYHLYVKWFKLLNR